jgi:hypothetical protein
MAGPWFKQGAQDGAYVLITGSYIKHRDQRWLLYSKLVPLLSTGSKMVAKKKLFRPLTFRI